MQELLPTAAKASPRPAMSEAMLARAFHDAVSPFNASLGYLEVIADPDLSPEDIVTFRSYAIDARRAVSEAHRNTVLMGRWLRLSATGEQQLHAITPAALIEDAIRGFNLAERDDVPEITVNAPRHMGEVMVHADACRFAAQILLRSALALEDIPDRIELDAKLADDSLILGIRIEGRAEFPKSPDAFQLLVEKVAASFTALAFHEDGPAQRRLVIRNAVCASGAHPDAAQSQIITLPSRMAS